MGGLPRRAGARVMDRATLVSVAHAPGTSRTAARTAIRAALCASVTQTLGLSGVRVESVPGAAPRLFANGAPTTIGIAISHTASQSFAAWRAGARLGLDVMEVAELPDWREVARDYLGTQALARLDAAPVATRALAFAREWTAREASLKCLGLGLSEWVELRASPVLTALALPPGFCGTLAQQG